MKVNREYKKEQALLVPFCVVELRRIELLSENKSTQASPSAGYDLNSL